MKYNSLIPELTVSNIAKSKDFYLRILGFKLEYERSEDKFAFISYENLQLMIQEENHVWDVGPLTYPYGNGINFEMTVSDVEKLYERVLNSKITPFCPLSIKFYRNNEELIEQHEFLIQDPDGYLLRFTD